MRLRTYLMTASGASIGFILICLYVSYYKMLSFNQMIWLGAVTAIAGLLSFALHFFMTRPIETSITSIAKVAGRIADGDFQGKAPHRGPLEFQQLAAQFNDMNDKLKLSFEQIRQSEASRKELVANVSHDLRTPLASIQSFVEALQDGVISEPELIRSYLNTIKTETYRLSGLIDDLFQLSRLESDSFPHEPERFHVDVILLESLQSHALQIEKRSLEVTVDIPETLPEAYIVPQQIKRVMANLLQNALRYAPEGSRITIAAARDCLDAAWIRMSVRDEGEGMEEGEAEKVFERFYRADPSRNRESGGAGLGLAIAKSIIGKHGGRIGVVSEPGAGSEFWFTIPIYGKQNDG